MRVIVTAMLAAIALGSGALPAGAQTLMPMRADLKSMNDRFAIRVIAGNPYGERLPFRIRVFDSNFNEIPAMVQPSEPAIAGGGSRSILVIIPFDGHFTRKVRICTETVPLQNNPYRLRGQVCGRYRARRVG